MFSAGSRAPLPRADIMLRDDPAFRQYADEFLVRYQKTDMSQSQTDISQSQTDISQSQTDISQSASTPVQSSPYVSAWGV